jgi:hypothetical protein
MNGNLIGAVNTPTLASASGVWDIEELKLAQQQNTWPLFRQPDPDFEYVSLLLSSETASINGAQNNTFQDSSTNNFTITRNGNTTQGSFSPYLPNWSNNFDGGANRLTTGTSSQFNLSGIDFTVECWVYMTSNPSVGNRLITIGPNAAQSSFSIAIRTDGVLSVSIPLSGQTTLTSGVNIVPLNAWTHIAFSLERGSNIGSIYINGNRVGQATGWGFTSTSSNYFYVGYDATATVDGKFTGYVSNVRFVAGAALYSDATITVPTSPLTAVAGTKYLSCQSNRFIDNSTNNFTITRNGDTRITPFSPFSSFVATKGYVPATYGGSGYFDGSGDYLSIANNSNLTFGSGDFTVETWVYKTTANNGWIAGFWSYTNPGNQSWALYDSSGYAFVIEGDQGAGDYAILSAANSSVLNQWTHVAVTRSGSTWRLFVNGVQSATATYSGTLATPGNSLGIGVVENAPSSYNAYLSNLRVVKGTAVYTANFTPPATPVTAVANTSLLLNFTNAGIVDNSTNNTLETIGNAQVSTSVKKYGSGSYYFDGTGDWCTIIDKPELRFGTGAFTVEFWLYLGATGAARGIIGKGTASTGWLISTNSSNNVVFTYSSSTITSAGALSSSTWYFITVVRQSTGSNQTKIYINGINDGTGTVSTDFTQTNIMYVGANRTGGDGLNGYISDLRLTNGLARYTTNFTPPTASLPNF